MMGLRQADLQRMDNYELRGMDLILNAFLQNQATLAGASQTSTNRSRSWSNGLSALDWMSGISEFLQSGGNAMAGWAAIR